MTGRIDPTLVVAERVLLAAALDPGRPPVVVSFRLGRPIQGADDWYCPFEVLGLGPARVDAAHGADSVQALVLALAKLRILLGALAQQHGVRLEFRGRDGPGLPSLFEERGAETLSPSGGGAP